MIDAPTLRHYKRLRKEGTPARYALTWSRTLSSGDGDWQDAGETRDGFPRWKRISDDGITVVASASYSGEGVDLDGDCYGKFVDRDRYAWEYYSRNKPAEPTPLNLPAAHFVWSFERGPDGWFFPSYIEEQFDAMRKSGMSRGVARDAIVKAIRSQINMAHDLANVIVTVTAYKEGIELASESCGTDIVDTWEERDNNRMHLREIADDFYQSTLDAARDAIKRLTAKA